MRSDSNEGNIVSVQESRQANVGFKIGCLLDHHVSAVEQRDALCDCADRMVAAGRSSAGRRLKRDSTCSLMRVDATHGYINDSVDIKSVVGECGGRSFSVQVGMGTGEETMQGPATQGAWGEHLKDRA